LGHHTRLCLFVTICGAEGSRTPVFHVINKSSTSLG
jgi:hypothetical protein